MSDSATTVPRVEIARLAGVSRAAVTSWSKHADFPAPTNADGDQFNLDDIIGWLDRRRVPADGRAPDEAANATYGNRIRRRLRLAEPRDAASPLTSLLALGPQVRGDAQQRDYLYLLLCLAFLRLHHPDRWMQLASLDPPSPLGDPSDARRLLWSVIGAVDESLGYPKLLRRPGPPPTRLRPIAFEPMRKVVQLAAGFLPSDV